MSKTILADLEDRGRPACFYRKAPALIPHFLSPSNRPPNSHEMSRTRFRPNRLQPTLVWIKAFEVLAQAMGPASAGQTIPRASHAVCAVDAHYYRRLSLVSQTEPFVPRLSCILEVRAQGQQTVPSLPASSKHSHPDNKRGFSELSVRAYTLSQSESPSHRQRSI